MLKLLAAIGRFISADSRIGSHIPPPPPPPPLKTPRITTDTPVVKGSEVKSPVLDTPPDSSDTVTHDIPPPPPLEEPKSRLKKIESDVNKSRLPPTDETRDVVNKTIAVLKGTFITGITFKAPTAEEARVSLERVEARIKEPRSPLGPDGKPTREGDLHTLRGDVNNISSSDAKRLLAAYESKRDDHPTLYMMLLQRSQAPDTPHRSDETAPLKSRVREYSTNIPPLPEVRNDGILHKIASVNLSSIARAILAGIDGGKGGDSDLGSKVFLGDVSLPMEPAIESQVTTHEPEEPTKDPPPIKVEPRRTDPVDEAEREARERVEKYLKADDSKDGHKLQSDLRKLSPETARELFERFKPKLDKYPVVLRVLEARGKESPTTTRTRVEEPPRDVRREEPQVELEKPVTKPKQPEIRPEEPVISTSSLAEQLQAQRAKLKKVSVPEPVTTPVAETVCRPFSLATSPGGDGKPASGMGRFLANGKTYEFNTMEKQVTLTREDGTRLSYDLRLWGQVTDAKGTHNMKPEDKQALHDLLAEMKGALATAGATEKEIAEAGHLIAKLDKLIDALPPPQVKEPSEFERMVKAMQPMIDKATEMYGHRMDDDSPDWD